MQNGNVSALPIAQDSCDQMKLRECISTKKAGIMVWLLLPISLQAYL